MHMYKLTQLTPLYFSTETVQEKKGYVKEDSETQLIYKSKDQKLKLPIWFEQASLMSAKPRA